MSRETQPYRRSFSGSIGAGLGSVFGASGKQYYILEHKMSSRYHKVGESQEIIIDNIEIGRDPKCQVRFDDSFTTVSRRHAAIVKDGDKWKLVQLSTTNPTYLNGMKVTKEWYLQNGDEIQLSTGGPKLGFIVPSGNKSTVGTIGLSRRLSLFRQQALRPYKTAITLLSIFLVIAIGGLSTWMIINDRNWQKKIEISKKQIDDLEKQSKKFKEELAHTTIDKDKLMKKVASLENKERKRAVSEKVVIADAQQTSSIYYIRLDDIYIELDGKQYHYPEDEYWSGTGFLLDDGRFITARHVVDAWAFIDNVETSLAALTLNYIATKGGSVVAHFTAYSSGHQFSFTSEQFKWDNSGDEEVFDENYNKYMVAKPDYRDWAVFRTNLTGNLKANSQLSTSLKTGTKLQVLGFPFGLGANSSREIKPIYGSAIVACDGLDKNLILTTDSNFEHGNSGGPVMCTDANGNTVVVGIVSAGAGRNIGFVVPIAHVK